MREEQGIKLFVVISFRLNNIFFSFKRHDRFEKVHAYNHFSCGIRNRIYIRRKKIRKRGQYKKNLMYITRRFKSAIEIFDFSTATNLFFKFKVYDVNPIYLRFIREMIDELEENEYTFTYKMLFLQSHNGCKRKLRRKFNL